MDWEITSNGTGDVERMLRKALHIAAEVQTRGLPRCGVIARRTAKEYAPRSPTMKQLSATLKRKRRTSHRTHPGGLEKSIEFEVKGDSCAVFVPENAYCVSVSRKTGKRFNYAKRIHDEKGVTWHNRGPGTIAKGAQADEKFIERAITDKGDTFREIFDDELGSAIARTCGTFEGDF